MKKFLSLVLALQMTMSLVTVSAGAKDFSDSTKTSKKPSTMSAVNVISVMPKVTSSHRHPDRWRPPPRSSAT
ncbi:MAG: hypothetical protein ACLUPV_05270 [Bilophila wadsworthia]